MATSLPDHGLRSVPGGLSSLLPALFEFAAMPGRFSIALREPRVAFDNVQAVLLLACGRTVEAVPLGNASEADVRRVARYFVRTAMLRPGADYYTMMGVQPGFAETTLREHYRLLMRLSHPDFATPGQAWPADAATRINQANDVLSSAVRRHEYDVTAAPSSLTRPQQPAVNVASMMMRRVPPPPSKSVLTRAGAALAALCGRAAGAVARVSVTNRLASVRLPRVGASARTVAFASVVAAAGGSALTVWWLQGDDEGGGQGLAASKPAAPPDGLDGSAYGPTLRASAELHLPATVLSRSVEKPPHDKAQAAQAEVAGEFLPADPRAPEPRSQPRTQPAMRPALQQVDTAAPAFNRTARMHVSRDAGAFQFSFTPPGARKPAEGQAQQAQQAPDYPPMFAPASIPPPETLAAAAVAPVAPPVRAVAVAPPTPAAVAPPAPVVAEPPRPAPRISMADVQPTLVNVIGAMQSGRAENVLQMVDAASRRADGLAFSEAYNKTVSGAKAVNLGKVSFRGAPQDDQLVVDGTIQLMVMDGNSVTTPKDLHIKAWFVARAGTPVLTRLSATSARQ